VRGTSLSRDFGVFFAAFVGIMLLLFIVQALTHPNAWCPSPMYIDSNGICRQH
jgi:hypothetical protein